MALQIGHRISVNLDFFTQKEFNEKTFIQKIIVSHKNFQLERMEWGTILGYLEKTRFSLFFYDYPLIDKLKNFLNIDVANVKDIAPMKLLAISDRGTKRDFIDLYFIIKIEKLFSLEEIFDLYNRLLRKPSFCCNS